MPRSFAQRITSCPYQDRKLPSRPLTSFHLAFILNVVPHWILADRGWEG
jgi:hypothetical protein